MKGFGPKLLYKKHMLIGVSQSKDLDLLKSLTQKI
jgi:hypothetical protein